MCAKYVSERHIPGGGVIIIARLEEVQKYYLFLQYMFYLKWTVKCCLNKRKIWSLIHKS